MLASSGTVTLRSASREGAGQRGDVVLGTHTFTGSTQLSEIAATPVAVSANPHQSGARRAVPARISGTERAQV